MFDKEKVPSSGVEVESAVRKLRDEVRQLELRLERQTLLLQSFFTLMSEHSDISEAQLLERVTRLAAEKSNTRAKNCPQCDRPLGKRKQCMYCGGKLPVDSAFDLL
jgi:hypothetical protein